MSSELDALRSALAQIENEMRNSPTRYASLLSSLHSSQLESAKNLLNYLILRKTDIQQLQANLHEVGLSSLASCESHVLRQIQVTLARLGVSFAQYDPCTLEFGAEQIRKNAERLFGLHHAEWPSSVMVTFDRSFLNEKKYIEKLLQNGMGVARINCAHDDPDTWKQMVEEIHRTCKKTGLSCALHFDLAGPKIRTVLLRKGKDAGKAEIKVGGRVWLSDSGKGFSSKDVVVSPNEAGLLEHLKVGERIYFDDGLIRARVDRISKKGVALKVERISSKKPLLKNEKGINFPDSVLAISSLTDFDRKCLAMVVKLADTVGFSFVRTPEDLEDLRKELAKLTATPPPVILKIETRDAVVQLPALLLESMKEPCFGVMIARGDLAVEIGFERLVEIQEEISWICEAGHVPVIWATQVLENLHKSGIASRAEITDAGRAAMAECIMINKGEHTLEVLKTLKDIAKRSRALKVKNRLIFRPLRIAENFLEQN
ncbi:pyruvate kinase [Algoriphagus confluentis]|uniref:Pyruvate kinase n=1 Tax=Algoriphagus confluentis TaxID=1697556 RepID=A0ABQ6PKN4_9BACT|nr:pyruvate kinase [Algoriphagus confluentis]